MNFEKGEVAWEDGIVTKPARQFGNAIGLSGYHAMELSFQYLWNSLVEIGYFTSSHFPICQ